MSNNLNVLHFYKEHIIEGLIRWQIWIVYDNKSYWFDVIHNSVFRRDKDKNKPVELVVVGGIKECRHQQILKDFCIYLVELSERLNSKSGQMG